MIIITTPLLNWTNAKTHNIIYKENMWNKKILTRTWCPWCFHPFFSFEMHLMRSSIFKKNNKGDNEHPCRRALDVVKNYVGFPFIRMEKFTEVHIPLYIWLIYMESQFAWEPTSKNPNELCHMLCWYLVEEPWPFNSSF